MDLLPDAAASQERLDLPILGNATELDFNVFPKRPGILAAAAFGLAVLAQAVAAPAFASAQSTAAAAPSPFAYVRIADHFDLAAGLQPENIVLEGNGVVDLSMSLARQIVRVFPDGAEQVLATMPVPADGGIHTPELGRPSVLGIIRTPDGTIYFLYATGTSDLTGIWRLRPGGTPERITALPANGLPNGLGLDEAAGELYVTDSILGTVWRSSIHGGPATAWAIGPALSPTSFVGANGLKVHHGAVWVTNTDLGTIARIPIEADGSAGPARVTASGMAGIDDFAFIGNSDRIIAAINLQNEVDLVQPDGTHTVVLTGQDGLSGPSAVAVRGREVYITSASYFLKQDPNLIIARLR